MKIKKTLESDAVNHGNKFCHPAHDDEQKQQAAAAAATSVLHSSRDVCTNTYSYVVQQRTAQYVSNDPY